MRLSKQYRRRALERIGATFHNGRAYVVCKKPGPFFVPVVLVYDQFSKGSTVYTLQGMGKLDSGNYRDVPFPFIDRPELLLLVE